MATSLAAAIENKFGLRANLTEGHNGIYEIIVNNTLVYSNEACEHPPVEDDVFAEISKYQKPLTAQDLPGKTTDPTSTDAPVCAWTPPPAKQPA
jgi:hypothetical protein